MDIILVPGMWLGGWAWYAVAPKLEASGHRPHAMTLPGMGRDDGDRSAVTQQDAVDAVIAEIDACEAPVIVVGHSAGCGIVSLAVAARPDKVARAIYISGFPAVEGRPLVEGYTVEDGVIPLPAWSEFDEADTRDLGEAGQEALAAYAVPTPARVVGDEANYAGDERRYDIPVTVIATEFTSDDLLSWIAEGAPPVQEFTRIKDVTYVDIPTGHWPMLTRPDELTEAILSQPPIGSGRVRSAISAKEFHEASGVDDWRVLYFGAYAFYRAESYDQAVRLTVEIGRIADELEHYPDVDLRREGVTVRTFSRRSGGLTGSDIELAQRVSAAARELGMEPDPTNLQQVGIAIAHDPDIDVRPFFAAAFGYEELGMEDAIDANRRGPHLWFQQMEPAKPRRGRMHIDVSVPPDVARKRIEAALAAGGRMADDSHAPDYWTLASPDNHGVDIAAWTDFDDR